MVLPFLLLTVGIGSFLLHGTQRYVPELVDELGLMIFTVIDMYAVMRW